MHAESCFDSASLPLMCYPGHVRIKVPGLFRSPETQQKIETALAGHQHIHAVYANPLTGKVLVQFDQTISPERMLEMLGVPQCVPPSLSAQSAPPIPPRARQSRHIHRQTPPSEPTPRPNRDPYPPWHRQEADAALAHYGSSAQTGLPSSIAERRLKDGLNLLPQQRARSSLEILASQFRSLPILLLAVSAGISLLTGGISEAITVAAVLAMNGAIGFVTERQAESTIASLSELVDEAVLVLRDGNIQLISAHHIVTGDILVLAKGVQVAADARLIEAQDLTVDESPLTGESRFAPKNCAMLATPAALADRANMIYMGTAIASGSGRAIVVGTGANTEIGSIQSLMVHTAHPKTPLQQQLDSLGNRLVGISSVICIVILIIGLLRGHRLLPMFKSALSLAIAAVPEGLPTVATTSLARGLRLMREKQMLIRRLQAVETLGAVHTICMDKTGTLTLNRMSVVALQAGNDDYTLQDGRLPMAALPQQASVDTPLSYLLKICVLCHEANTPSGNALTATSSGSATENALLEVAVNAGIPVGDLRREYSALSATLRTEGRNYMCTVHAMPDPGKNFIAVKGNPAEVLNLCTHFHAGDRIVPLTGNLRTAIRRQNDSMAERQLRVLGFAYGERTVQSGDDEAARNLVWVGLAGLADPLRSGAVQFIAQLHQAGIRTTMVTGDQRITAQAIGKSLQLANGRKPHILDSAYLDDIHPAELKRLAAQADIFARVSPKRKLQIVQALQESGEIVAMIGDGINDGPALQASNVGIAMGLEGTDLARSAADVVLKDNRLETIIEAIRQGRSITSNIEKSIHFLVASNLSEIFVVLGAISTVGTTPLSPMHLLWINLLTDVLPAVALAAEPPDEDVMRHPSRQAGKSLIDNSELKRYAIEGGLLASGALSSYLYGMARYGIGPRASSLCFNSLVIGQLLHALTCRSRRSREANSRNAGLNSKLNLAVGGSLALQLVANLVPVLRRLLNIGPTSVADIAVILAGAGIPFMLNSARKERYPA